MSDPTPNRTEPGVPKKTRRAGRICCVVLSAGLPLVLSGCITAHDPAATPTLKVHHSVPESATPPTISTHLGQAVPRPSPAASVKACASSSDDCFRRVVDRLQELDYLPLEQTVIHGRSGPVRYDFFRFAVPAVLQRTADSFPWNWSNPFIRGALIQFERTSGTLKALGVSEGHWHPALAPALFSPKARKDPWLWEWVLVDKYDGSTRPETLSIWRAGESGPIWTTRVNTGVLGSTPDGTWPIYQRLPVTTMRGVFPVPVSRTTYEELAGQRVPQWSGSSLSQSARGLVNGHPVRWQPYNDPGIRWVDYFDDGRGIHYYPRASYGFPQSAGCVEEPVSAAPITYRLLHYGVPVTVLAGSHPKRSTSSPPLPGPPR